MSGEAAAVMTSREPFTATPTISPAPAQHQPAPQPQMDQQMRGPYNAAQQPMGSPPPFQSITGGVANQQMSMNSSEQKRKRGRPRKYGPDGSMAMVVSSAPQPMSVSVPPTQTFSPPPPPPPPPAANPPAPAESQPPMSESISPSVKKARGRPPGSSNKKKQLEAIGSTGIGFIPHVINVKAGEDVCSKVMAFSQNGPRTVCILSATGAVSNVTLRQSATCGGTATYEGRFDILSLSGSFMLSDVGGQKSRTGGLSTTLAGPDGRVFGGCVAGLLIAASPVQVIVGSFLAEGRKEPKPTNHMEQLSGPQQVNFGGAAAGTSSSPSRGTFSESSGGPNSPPNLSSAACNNNNHPQGMSGISWK